MKRILLIGGVLLVALFLIVASSGEEKSATEEIQEVSVEENSDSKVASHCTPSSWQRIASPVKNVAGGHLSPLQIAADPSVFYENGTYRMWFTNTNSKDQVGPAYAESKDGKTWTIWKNKNNPDPLMDLAVVPAQWDAPGIETVNVMKAPSGEYRMYYSGNQPPSGSFTFSIGLATSDDGVTWKRYGNGPVFESKNNWEKPTCENGRCVNGGVLEPSVIYDADEKLYKMWYAGFGTKNEILAFRIGYATSKDGISWTRRAEPVLDRGGSGAWDEILVSHVNVIEDPVEGYHMFYFGQKASDYKDGVEIQRGSIGHAYSSDGISWVRDGKNPVIKYGSDWGKWSVGGPSAIYRDGKLQVFYFGNQDSGLASNIGLVEAACSQESAFSPHNLIDQAASVADGVSGFLLR